MSAHRRLWALHPSGTCDECDQERDQQEWEHEQEQREPAAEEGECRASA